MKQSHPIESERQNNNRSHLAVSNASPVSQAFVDNRESTALQRQLIAKMTNSPQAIAQRKLSEQMNNSPRMLAQRQQIAKMPGNAVQRVEGEEELLQGKFKTIQRVEEEELLQGKFGVAQRVEEEELLQGKFAPIQRIEEEELLQGKFAPVQRVEEEELLQGKFDSVQRVEEEELLQGEFDTVQRVEEEEPMQGKFDTAQLEQAPAEKANNTGLPDNLKQGIENLSGMSMDNVKVHYNSSKPAQLNALAYAQGTDIHLGTGQEKHLPHEAWHVVQQAQGRVKPTMQMKDGVPVNDDQALEHEADVMGARAIQVKKNNAAFDKKLDVMSEALQYAIDPIQLKKLAGFTLSSHAEERMGEYSLSDDDVKDVIENGTEYDDTRPQHVGQTIYWKDNVAVAVKNGTITTVMNNARVKSAWVKK